jgi:hypothetical protein
MSDPNWQPPQAGDPGTPRDVNRESDVVWDGRDTAKYAGQEPETNEDAANDQQNQPTKATKAAKRTTARRDNDAQE